jgi:hypothetical protein
MYIARGSESMNPSLKYGLIVGCIGLAMNLLVSSVIGLAGLGIVLLAGIAAGWLTARAHPTPPRTARAASGALAGMLSATGQLAGVVLGFWYIHQQGLDLLSLSSATTSATVWIVGIVLTGSLMLAGLGLGAGGGALAGSPVVAQHPGGHVQQQMQQPAWLLHGMIAGLVLGIVFGNSGIGLGIGMLVGIIIDVIITSRRKQT